MKNFGLATLLALATPASQAGEGRVVFVCGPGTATCELAAQRFEAQSRTNGWNLAGRAAVVDDVTEAELALAVVVVAIDASLYRHWLLSIKRFETWDDIPPVERDRAASEAAIDRRLQTLATSFSKQAGTAEAAALPRPCPPRHYACFMANVASLSEGLAREEVERRLGAPSRIADAEPAENWRDTVLIWSLDGLTLQRPEQPAWSVEVSLAKDRVVHVRTIGWLER